MQTTGGASCMNSNVLFLSDRILETPTVLWLGAHTLLQLLQPMHTAWGPTPAPGWPGRRWWDDRTAPAPTACCCGTAGIICCLPPPGPGMTGNLWGAVLSGLADTVLPLTYCYSHIEVQSSVGAATHLSLFNKEIKTTSRQKLAVPFIFSKEPKVCSSSWIYFLDLHKTWY